MSTAGPPSPPVASRYLVSAPVDVALIGGASMATYLLLALWRAAGGSLELAAVVAVLGPLVNWPHFAASSYRLYHTRDNIRQYPVTALAVPLLVGAGMLAAFAAPHTVAPAFVKVMLLWSPYHFGGQALGLSLVYARRTGFPVGRLERLALAGFIFTAFLAATAHVETGPGVRHYLGVDHPRLGLPPAVAAGLDLLVWGWAGLLVGVVARTCRRTGRRLPLIVCVPAATQGLWFVLARGDEAFQILVPFFHSLQYLFVAWGVQLRERLAAGRATPSRLFVVGESVRWWTGNTVLGLALFLGFPYCCTLFGAELGLAMALTSSAVQLHHFFVDGVIWKLKNPRVSSPLLASVRDFVARPVRAAEVAA